MASISYDLKLMTLLTQFDSYFQYPSLAINVFVVLLSKFAVPNSICRIYAMNISVVTVVTVMFYVIMTETSDVPTVKRRYALVHMFYTIARNYGFFCYPFLSAVTMFMVYMAYAYPVIYLKMSRKKFTVCIFSIANILALVCAILQNPMSYTGNKMLQAGLSWLQTTIICLVFMVTTVFYVLVIVSTINHIRNRKLLCKNTREKWSTLTAFLIYSTPPNILTLSSIPGYVCISISFTTASQSSYTCVLFIMIGGYMILGKIFLTTFTILFAFRDYRVAMVNIAKDVVRRVRRKPTIVEVSCSVQNRSLM
uniref:G_PROTEIN_RECEP_F1_2 domain-containing protein n=2 Tax=Steinernema glaseri TaxID=37863 RepID=A0A1I7YU71_9BILA